MYRRLLLLAMVLCVTMLCALEQVITFQSNTENIKVADSSPERLILDYSVSQLQLSETDNFTKIILDGFGGNNDVGRPELPYLGALITVPINASLKINYLTSKTTDISLKELGFAHPIYPAQPSYSKSQDMSRVTFQHDLASYQKPDYQGDYSPFKTEEVGFARGYRVFEVIFTPVQYNPVENTLKIYTQLTVEIDFIGADHYATEYERARTWSADFEAVFQTSFLNYEPPSTRDTLMRTPTKYIIICHNASFATAMQPFVDWKIQQGFEVTVTTAYTTTTTIKNYLQSLWDAATPQNPAPTYLLIVGDTAQIPAFNSTTSSSSEPHVSDLSYVRLNGSDYLNDMYFGRFSATSTTEIQNIIDKTLMYEKYTMPDPTYLKKSLLIAGVESQNNYAQTYCNSMVNYVASQYIKADSQDHTYDAPYTYFHPSSGNSASTIRTQFSTGVGWANYSAHGNITEWSNPSFTNSHVNSLTNSGKYPVAIGNACLTNAFQNATSFSEAMVRTANKGAVAYIGGTNYTYWNEDWRWAAGNKTAPTSGNGATYSSSSLGMYDRLFHTHGEATSNWDVSVGAMVYIGNNVVQSISSSLKAYYWEIYGIMGDPSLVPYLGLPSANNAQYPSQINIGAGSIAITGAGALARIALSRNGVLAGMVIADANGNATLNFTPFSSAGAANLVITAQNKIPIITTVNVGNGTEPGFAYSPTSHYFGDFFVNQTSPIQTFTIQSVVNGPVTINTVTKSGANAGDFTLIAAGLPWTLQTGGTQSFTVSFTPTSLGAKTATITITSSIAGSPHTISVSGTGASPGLPLPYTQNFNSGTSMEAIDWIGDFSAYPSYSGIQANKGVGGSNALVMNVWGSDPTLSATAPRIAAITANTTLSFAYKIVPYSGSNGYALTAGDKVYIEASSTGPSGTYSTIREINSGNHSTTSDFTTLNLPLTAYNNQNINIQFRAVRTAGDWNFILDDVSVISTTHPTPPPTGFTASVNGTNVTLNWTAPQNPQNLTGYTLHRDTTLLTASPISALTYTDQNLSPGTYTYSVRAVYSAGTSEPVTAQAVVTSQSFNVPYTQDFNSGTNLANINWTGVSLTSYSGIKASSGVSNTNGLCFNVYSNTVTQSAYTPTITGITTSTTLSVAYRIVTYPANNNWSTTITGYELADDNKGIIEISTAGGTGTYTVLQEINSANHTTSATFATLNLPLSAYNAQNINIRFRAAWGTGGGDWVFVVDDIVVANSSTPPPEPPQNLSATAGNNSVSLAWTAPASGTPQGYKVYRGSTATTGVINALLYTDNTAVNGNTYSYHVSAVYAGGVEVASEPVSVTLDNITAPTGLSATVQMYDVTLSWDSGSVGTQLFPSSGGVAAKQTGWSTSGKTVNRLDAPQNIVGTQFIASGKTVNRLDAPQNIVGTQFIASANNDLTRSFLGYKVYQGTTLLTSQPINTLTYTHQNVTPGTYSYKVSAVFSNGESSPTEIANVSVYNIQPPSNLQATTPGTLTVSLVWTAPTSISGFTHYNLYRQTGEVGDFELLPDDITSPEYTDSGLVNMTTYTYRVTAVFANGESTPTSEVSATPTAVFNAPAALSATAGDAEVSLSWTPPETHTNLATLTGYKVYRDGSLLPDGTLTNPATLTFTDDSVVNDNTYTYYVVATYTDPVGESQPSETASASPVTELDEVTVPVTTALSGNYPNPFNPETTIRFSMAREDRVVIDIYAVNGQKVRSLLEGVYGVGVHSAVWNGRDDIGRSVGSGVYFYRMTTSGYSSVKKMLLLK